jgi:hypothetical protein
VLQVGQKLAALAQGRLPDDYPAEGQRSPSPDPVYNEAGIRTNTREQRLREALIRQRNVRSAAGMQRLGARVVHAKTNLTWALLMPTQEIIGRMIQCNPNFKPPTDYRPEKKSRKLRIPQVRARLVSALEHSTTNLMCSKFQHSTPYLLCHRMSILATTSLGSSLGPGGTHR